MICHLYPFDTIGHYKYVVVLSVYQGRLLFSRHRRRNTWETQGGHIEAGETPLAAARRELWEESGAEDYQLIPLCDYWAADEGGHANGQMFIAHISRLGALPPSEMAQVGSFDRLPPNLTYPAITPRAYALAKQRGLL